MQRTPMIWNRRDEDEASRRPDRSWSTRLAWVTLFGGGVLLLARVSVATVVQIHGDGMAPTLLDGDHVLIVRDRWSIERGDVVVYDPSLPPALPEEAPQWAEGDDPRGFEPDGKEFPDVRDSPREEFRNTAVVERDELDRNWERVQRKSEGLAGVYRSGPLRLGRVLAVPGDRITLHDERGALGLVINGDPVIQKPSDPMLLSLEGEGVDEGPGAPRLRPVAYETTDERRYPVLVSTGDGAVYEWPGMELPPAELGPVELTAPGYLVLADNRAEGACCDSRAVGWIAEDSIKGRVIVRLAGDPEAAPEMDPESRGFLWKP